MGLRAAYAMQGNNKPLAKMGEWATTFDNHEGAKAPAVRLIASITTPHHCHGAPKCLQWNWSLCNHHCNKCVGQRPLCRHRGKQRRVAPHDNQCCWLHKQQHKHCVRTSISGMCRSCQRSPPLMACTHTPRDKQLVGEGVELLTTINLIGDWAMGNSDLCTLK